MGNKEQRVSACGFGILYATYFSPLLSGNSQFKPEAPHLKEGEPDVRQSKSGNRAPQEIVVRNRCDRWIVVNKIISEPQPIPGKDKKKYPQFETEDDVDDGREAIHGLIGPGIRSQVRR